MSKKLRSGFFALVAAVFALAVLIAPKTAWAADTKWSYTSEDPAISIEYQEETWGVRFRTVNITVVVDGEQVASDAINDVHMTTGGLQIDVPDGYSINVDVDGKVLEGILGGWYGVSVIDATSSTVNVRVSIATEKSAADTVISDSSTGTEYGTFSWSKPTADTAAFERDLNVYVNYSDGDEPAYTQQIYTPKSLSNGVGAGNQFWFTPNSALYTHDVEVSPSNLNTSVQRDVNVYLTTRCGCGLSTCLCEGGCDCPAECTCPDCQGTNLGANQINTGYGVITYNPDSEDGYKTYVRVFVNGVAEYAPDDPIYIAYGPENFGFSPADGYNYFDNYSVNSYDLYAYSPSARWYYNIDTIDFVDVREEAKNHETVLNIYLWTFSNYTSVNVDRDPEVGDLTGSYLISYEALNPQTGQYETYTYEATSFDASEAQIIPRNTDVKLIGKCDPGFEVKKWYTDDAGEQGVSLTGNKGIEEPTVARDVALGNEATLRVNNAQTTVVLVRIDEIGLADVPTSEEVIDLVGENGVLVERAEPACLLLSEGRSEAVPLLPLRAEDQQQSVP